MMRIGITLSLCLAASACTQSLSEIGQAPVLSKVGYGLAGSNTSQLPRDYQQMATQPRNKPYSLWNTRIGDLFSDKLALDPGDILTVKISISDKASLSNKSDSARTVGRGLGLSGDYSVAGVGAASSGNGKVNSTSDFTGTGGTARSEKIELSIAAVVTRVLDNGNLIVRGSQEVRVNSEMRVLTIAGIVRPTDIGANNTIAYDRIAEARISYGGRGHITQVQRPPYGQQILNQLLPF